MTPQVSMTYRWAPIVDPLSSSSSSTIEGTGDLEQVMIAVISRLIRFPSGISRRHCRVDLRVSLEGEREVEKVWSPSGKWSKQWENGSPVLCFCVKRVIGLIFCFNAQLDLEVSLFNFGFRVLYWVYWSVKLFDRFWQVVCFRIGTMFFFKVRRFGSFMHNLNNFDREMDWKTLERYNLSLMISKFDIFCVLFYK